ncbi:apelin receptor early endogenous ligand [Pangasianodon hypophthalmus]|uniref:apelin receptor early endogenous ligand n=1 Tax=Pangasianodon hypophthalmus TaxID=310915 RepID=UPI00148199BA|nr:apelin receptor early endogenous ligand [Pangasianodon hypophthalmus]
MRFFHPLFILLLLLTVLMLVSAQKPGCKHNFLNLRRKYRRHHCPHKRCLPLHSRVPFP